MLEARQIFENSSEVSELSRLYEAAFPENERRPLAPLLRDRDGHAETLAFYDGEQFVGFACLLFVGDIAHIIYFATEEALRGRGYGAAALGLMRGRYVGCRIIVDVERERGGAPNELRRRRRNFYLRNGYAETGVRYDWRGEDYEILSNGGAVSDEEFENFYRTLDRETDVLSNY